MKLRFALLFPIILMGCQSTLEGEVSPVSKGKKPSQTVSIQKVKPIVDIKYIQRALGLPWEVEPAGITTKSFNTCEMRGFPKSPCLEKYLTVVNFQMYCRDSQGTVEYVDQYSYRPVQARNVRWKINGDWGDTSLNGEGRGQIVALSNKPIKYERVILIKNKNSMQLRVNQMNKIIVPRDWCY